MPAITRYQLLAHLEEVMVRVTAGESFVILAAGQQKPLAVLSPSAEVAARHRDAALELVEWLASGSSGFTPEVLELIRTDADMDDPRWPPPSD